MVPYVLVKFSQKGPVLIGFVDPNRYTWASLIGAMETDANLMDSYDVITLPFHLYEAPSP